MPRIKDYLEYAINPGTNVRIDGVVHELHDVLKVWTRCYRSVAIEGPTEDVVMATWRSMVTRDFPTCIACLGVVDD